MPMIRIVDGTGGGGSVRTLDTGARTYIPEVHGWETSRSQSMANVPVVRAGARPLRGPRRGAGGGQPLCGDGEGLSAKCSPPGRRW